MIVHGLTCRLLSWNLFSISFNWSIKDSFSFSILILNEFISSLNLLSLFFKAVLRDEIFSFNLEIKISFSFTSLACLLINASYSFFSWSIASDDGIEVGVSVGKGDGGAVGSDDGSGDGAKVGSKDGEIVGTYDDGLVDGVDVEARDGAGVGKNDGVNEGDSVGSNEDGATEGTHEVGTSVGADDGMKVTMLGVGLSVGDWLGDSVELDK